MNFEKVIFAFFTILACTLNFGFFWGELDRPELHHPAELFATVVVNLVTVVIKFGDRTQLGATHLATSLVASLQLLAAALVWGLHSSVQHLDMDTRTMAVIVSMSGGALMANIISIALLIGETLRHGR